MGEVDFSIAALFLKAHWIVQGVIIILVIASFWSWAVIVDKWLMLRRARQGQEAFEAEFWSGRPLDDLYDRIVHTAGNSAEKVFVAGMREWRRSFQTDGTMTPGAQQRIDRAMAVATDREVERIERWMGFLATVGSITPFLGLFGTVWGIKTSFEAIALSQNTSLAVVAPGIAEALVATALGLFTAIPAVVAYNALSDKINRMSGRLDNFSDEFSALLSRQIGRQPG